MKNLFRGAAFLAILTGLFAFAQAHGADAPEAPPSVSNTAGVVVFDVNNEPQVLLFISKTGQIAAATIAQCKAVPACVALAEALHDAGHAYVINVKPDHQI
jgi:hypothetical protein